MRTCPPRDLPLCGQVLTQRDTVSTIAANRTDFEASTATLTIIDIALHPCRMFQVVNERYLHRRPMLFTTNKPLAAWGLVLHDPDLAEAILDRVLERGRLVELRGASYRTRHLKRIELTRSPGSEPAGISGIHRQDFPEPTRALCDRAARKHRGGAPIARKHDARRAHFTRAQTEASSRLGAKSEHILSIV